MKKVILVICFSAIISGFYSLRESLPKWSAESPRNEQILNITEDSNLDSTQANPEFRAVTFNREDGGEIPLVDQAQFNFERYSHLRAELENADPESFNLRSDLGWFTLYFLDYAPTEAVKWILNRPPEGIFETAYMMGGIDLGERNKVEDLRNFADQLTGKSRLLFVRGISEGLAQQSPIGAFEFLRDQEVKIGGKVFEDNTTIVHRGISNGKIEETFEAIKLNIPRESLSETIAYAYNAYARKDPTEAANHAFENFEQSRDLDLFLKRILSQWRSTGSKGMEEWKNSLTLDRRLKVDSMIEYLISQ